MTADREGLTLSSTTLRWFNIIVAACAFLGPPASLLIGIVVFVAVQEKIDQRQDEKIAESRALIDKSDAKFDRINDDLSDIKQVLNQIVGKLNK